MKRWHEGKRKEVESEKSDAFIQDILKVYEKHGLSLGHQDNHGAFLIEKNSCANRDWMQAASIRSGVDDE